MADEPKAVPVPVRGRGRPRVSQPRTITLSIRLRTVEYDALCQKAGRGEKVADLGRRAIRLFLNE